MLYELDIAKKYLIPRLRYLSMSLISLLSVLVISLVVWLAVVFFSAKEGMEKTWTEKLITLTAPLRVFPKDAYYETYYYLIDGHSEQSGYSYKTLKEKLESEKTDPYNPFRDPALPLNFPKKRGSKDFVKELYKGLQAIPHTQLSLYNTASVTTTVKTADRVLTQPSYLLSFDPHTPHFDKVLIESIEKKGSGFPVFLPKSFLDTGVKLGDSGSFSYFLIAPSSVKEQHARFYVQGFYDPGIIPIGGKLVLAPEELVNLIQGASKSDKSFLPSGFNVRFSNYNDAANMQKKVEEMLEEKGLTAFFSVERYDQYDFTKDLFLQFKSEKNLFSLISLIIIIVACSNIISMLVILVHDKRKEIAIIRALGGTKKSVAFIFGFCGFMMGAIGSMIGSILAFFTVKNLPAILHFISKLQGFDVLSVAFFGTVIPNEIHTSALIFVLIATGLTSTLAGSIAAIKAVQANISDTLRAE